MDRDVELALVERLRAGDTGAFDTIHAALNARLFNFLARLSRRRDVAEDLLEETWLRLVGRAPMLRPDTMLAPLLFTIARNLYISYCRSRAIEDTHAASLIGLWPVATPGPSPFEAAAANEAERRLETALAALPPHYREALLLTAVEDMTTAQAAGVCGTSPEAMRQRVSRGRVLLAQRMQELETGALRVLNEATT
jgi:RNA polymerase sigma-70 factor (ECF subfamily)